jgi:SAM-dependent methyltransferase
MSVPLLPARAGGKSYDEAYFPRWYRDRRTRVHAPADVRRKIHMVLGITERYLGRKLRSVLDIGAGEGTWGVALRRLRPRLRYLGIDPSDYIVRRHGRGRNIRPGRFEELPDMRLGGPYDLIVCADVMQYIPTPALELGVRHLATLLDGLAYLEAYTSGDEMEGDLDGWHQRSKARYRRLFADAGLTACGSHCYLSPDLAAKAVELELL